MKMYYPCNECIVQASCRKACQKYYDHYKLSTPPQTSFYSLQQALERDSIFIEYETYQKLGLSDLSYKTVHKKLKERYTPAVENNTWNKIWNKYKLTIIFLILILILIFLSR